MLIVGPLIGVIAVAACVAIAAARMAPSTYRWLARWSEHFMMWISTVALIPKLKVLNERKLLYECGALL
jgi:hypothetical protein